MADFRILSQNGLYYTVLVTVNGVEYQQIIISDKEGDELNAVLQTYADDYQTDIDMSE